MTKFEVCNRPKRISCGNITAKIESDTNVVVDIELKRNIIPSRVKY